MSKKVVTAPVETPKAAGAEETRYPKKQLIDNAKEAFGVYPEVLAGALKGIGKNELTITEAQAAIEQFKKRRVK